MDEQSYDPIVPVKVGKRCSKPSSVTCSCVSISYR